MRSSSLQQGFGGEKCFTPLGVTANEKLIFARRAMPFWFPSWMSVSPWRCELYQIWTKGDSPLKGRSGFSKPTLVCWKFNQETILVLCCVSYRVIVSLEPVTVSVCWCNWGPIANWKPLQNHFFCLSDISKHHPQIWPPRCPHTNPNCSDWSFIARSKLVQRWLTTCEVNADVWANFYASTMTVHVHTNQRLHAFPLFVFFTFILFIQAIYIYNYIICMMYERTSILSQTRYVSVLLQQPTTARIRLRPPEWGQRHQKNCWMKPSDVDVFFVVFVFLLYCIYVVWQQAGATNKLYHM